MYFSEVSIQNRVALYDFVIQIYKLVAILKKRNRKSQQWKK